MAEQTPTPSAGPKGAGEPIPTVTPAPPPGEAAVAPAPPVPPADVNPSNSSEILNAADEISIDELLKQASFEDPSALGTAVVAPDAADFQLPNFQQVMQDVQVSSIDLLRDVELDVKIELGRARMLVEDVLKLSEGSVVELDKLAGDAVDVFVNDRLVARGEVLVLNENFCVRVNEIVAGVKEEGL